MTNRFFSRNIRIFGNVAIMTLCFVFFLVPFAFRGARMAVQGIKNDVADWLPSDFPETRVLDKFREYFVGDAFVVISWPGEADGSERCAVGTTRYDVLNKKIRYESLQAEAEMTEEEVHAHLWGDRLGLNTTGDFKTEWGKNGEKWLMGKDDQWYYLTKQGVLYRWNGESNVVSGLTRSISRFFKGYNEATGEYIATFGQPTDNLYYKEPERLYARFFKDVLTGPDVVKQLAGEDGPLRAEHSEYEAKLLAHKRLTGSLFGPTPSTGFNWSKESFLEEVGRESSENYPEGIEENFQEYVDQLVEERYGGEFEHLIDAPSNERLENWFKFFWERDLEPPPRTTCLLVTLSKAGTADMSRVVGRPVLGKPMGRIFQLANEANLLKKDPEFATDLHLGGPPIDSVSIDEEGTITLIRLVGFSVLIGWVLAYLSFRSLSITFMVFFVGGVSAISSLGVVWFGGSTLDAILMSMPSLVYVLGLSGAVHVVNYYREACRESGPEGAAEIAVRHGFFPSALAAFTTALGLISLYISNLTPIKKFGLFSSIAVLITVALLFTYLPASLQLWPPGYKKREEELNSKRSIFDFIEAMWDRIGLFVVKHNRLVTAVVMISLIYFTIGILKIQTSVKLTKLFDDDAKILHDYRWLESNLGKLVPMELVMRVNESHQRPFEDEYETLTSKEKTMQLSFLERMELSSRVREMVELTFGELGKNYVGNGMDTSVFVPESKEQTGNGVIPRREIYNTSLEETRNQLYQLGYLRDENKTDVELWRVSLRLAALNDVDYGIFVSDLKTVVEPILSAYEYRTQIFESLYDKLSEEDVLKGRVLFLGWREGIVAGNVADRPVPPVLDGEVDQSAVFCRTMKDLMLNRGFSRKTKAKKYMRMLSESDQKELSTLRANDKSKDKYLNFFDTVVVLNDIPDFELEAIAPKCKSIVDARGHVFKIDKESKEPLSLTAQERVEQNEEALNVTAEYTGIVPIVYKAQRTLLKSLINSICLAFFMIAIVMMLLLRDWSRPPSLGNSLNIGGGLVSMLPNIFPVILIFGAMGHFEIAVDIGSMMTASVAMGVAVDDTIHFLSWFRQGLYAGLSRAEAVRKAYKHVATAMTQTTLIGGLGLSVFAFSTFTPTQRFGVLMLVLLAAALIGDLIFLPALLAGPLGRFFMVKKKDNGEKDGNGQSPEGLELSVPAVGGIDLTAQDKTALEANSTEASEPNEGKEARSRGSGNGIANGNGANGNGGNGNGGGSANGNGPVRFETPHSKKRPRTDSENRLN